MADRSFRVKLASFGNARCLLNPQPPSQFSEFDPLPNPHPKLWCWAPEVALVEEKICKFEKFCWKKADIWSFGCTIATILRCGEPLFSKVQAKKHVSEVLNVQELAVGLDKNGMKALEGMVFHPNPRLSLESLVKINRPKTDDETLMAACVDALKAMMAFEPQKRPSCDELAKLPFFQNIDEAITRTDLSPEAAQHLCDKHLFPDFIYNYCGGVASK